MFKTMLVLKRTVLGSLAIIITSFTPMSVFAADPSCVAPASNQPGVHQPVGADARTYTYNCGSGLWENAHFSYNPATGLTTATDPVVYTYNPASGNYDTTSWVYNDPDNAYVPYTQSVAQPPAGARVVGGPVAAGAAGASINNTGPGSSNNINNNGGMGGSQSISNTGPGSSNTLNGSNTNNLNFNNSTDASVNNILYGQANTGNAIVIGNTTAGNATSGNAQDMANVINLLQSSSSALGSGNVVTFVKNIDGNVNGDLLLNPAALSSIQGTGPDSNNMTNTNLNNKLTVNSSTNATINNNINLGANSGDTTVSSNTNGGNATSGNAQAIANVVNMINSSLKAGKSFISTININGNLNGDILLPPNFIDQLLADNVPTVTITGPSSTNTVNTNANNNTNVTNSNNLGINNKVNASAATGTATVSGNTKGGNATSGNANTHITAFNLTGSKVIGANDLLVFVNVTGTWVGLIINAPPGATAAELGGGITTSGPNSNNETNTNINNNATISNKVNGQINNNITTAAKSGGATVSGNTKGGNATSGNADSAVNLLNVENSSLDLSNWFGILFINVFGSWNGSFGVNTSAGDPIANSGGGAGTNTFKVFSFKPAGTAGSGRDSSHFNITPFFSGNGRTTGGNTNSGSGAISSPGAVLASATVKTNNKAPLAVSAPSRGHVNWLIIVISSTVFIASIFGDRFYSYRNSRIKA